MIDEKKIESVKEEIYEDRFLLNGEEIVFDNYEKEEMFYKDDIKEAIGLGAKWAVNELLKDLWHPASEEPEKNHFVLFKTAGNSFETEYIGKNDWLPSLDVLRLLSGSMLMICFQRKEVSNERA